MITQTNLLPVINRFVAVPDLPAGRCVTIATALATIAGSSLKKIAGRDTIILPSFERSSIYPHDYYATLRAAAIII